MSFTGLFIYFQTGDVFFAEEQKSEMGDYIEDGKDFQIKIKHFIYTDQNIVAFGLVSEVYFSGGLCKADKWFIFI